MANVRIGKRIKKLREDKNMSQLALAKLMGYTNNSVISKLENGDSELTATQINTLCDIFNISSNYLLTGDFKDLISKEKTVISDENKTITKNVVIKNNFKVLTLSDYLILISSLILFSIVPLFKNNKTKELLYGLLIIIGISILIYYVVIILLKKKRDTTNLNIPLNKNVIYYCTIDPFVFKKLRRDHAIFSILIIVINIFYYSILITLASSLSTVLAAIVIVFMAIFVMYKIYNVIINFKSIEKSNILLSVIIFVMQTIFDIVFWLVVLLTDHSKLNSQIIYFAAFNLFVSLILIITTQLFLKRYKYKIE